ncbi:MAG: hypothetical protein IJ105_03335 [Bacilli bacterium]|nr:hypothetical protein [Bacilli bacterium]
MKKILRYLEWLPFAIALGSLVIYIVYTIQIKMNPAIIITDKLISTLKTYLIIALVSLFIGLLIILIKKIRKLMLSEQTEKVITTTTVTQTPTKTEKVVISETKNNEEVKVLEKEPIIEKNIIHEPIKQTQVVEEKVVNNYTYKVKGIVCPECNNYISKNAGICPHCGILFDDEIIKVIKKYEKGKYKVRKNPLVTIANILLTILFIILIFLICNMLYNKYNENLKNINYIMQRR